MTDTLWKPTDEPDIIAAEHIIASAHYKSKDWTDVYLVPVAQYHALAARVQAVEEVNRIAAIKATVGDTEYSLRQQLAEAQGAVARLTDRIDLQCDEFQRISTLTENDEIKGLCARAVKDIRQHVSVIQQRDQAEQQVARLRHCLFVLKNEAQAVADDCHRPRYARLDEALESASTILRETGAGGQS